jgi:hypothetical protein
MDSISANPSSGAAARYLVILLAVTVAALGLIAALSMLYSASAAAYWPGYNDMVTSLPSPTAWLRWVLGDISEVAFYKHEFASVGLLLGGAFGYWASRYAQGWQGMALGSVVAFLLCRALPILVSRRPESTISSPPPTAVNIPDYGIRWTFRRVLADFSEAPFFGNEWASLGLIVGVFLAYALNPLSPAYGSGWLPQLVAGQALTSLLGILLWRRQWQKRGWYPTYVPLVSVVPAAVLVHGGSPLVIASSALLGALLAPPLACAIAGRLPQYMHPYIGNVMSMAISTALIVPLIGALLTL